MTTRLITPPTSEPLTLAEAKLQCKEDYAENDARIQLYISAAREQCEHILGRSIMPQTWELVLDSFPINNDIELQYPTIISITSIKYIDALTNLEVTLASTQYALDKDSEPGWVMPASGVTWPATADAANAVRVRYQAGYADAASVPTAIKAWILLAVDYLYNQYKEGNETTSIPRDFMGGVLDRYRIWNL